jgi:hypothetical protein
MVALLLISCNQDRGDCLVTKRFANGRAAAIACTNDQRGVQKVYLLGKNGDTTGTYTYELIDNYYYPRKAEIYKKNKLSVSMVHDRYDTNKVIKYFYDTSNVLDRVEYHINDTPYYYRQLTSYSISGYSFNYRIAISNVYTDSLIEMTVKLPIPDSIISLHDPLYFMYGGLYLEDTINWNENYFDIFLDNNLDSLKITSSETYNVYYQVSDTPKTHLITALYSPKDKSVHNIKKSKLYQTPLE